MNQKKSFFLASRMHTLDSSETPDEAHIKYHCNFSNISITKCIWCIDDQPIESNQIKSNQGKSGSTLSSIRCYTCKKNETEEKNERK